MPKEEKKKKMVVVEESPAEEVQETVDTPKVEPKVEETKLEEPKQEEVAVVESVTPESVGEVVEAPEKTNYLFIIVPTALLVGALVGGLITYFAGLSRLAETDLSPSPTPTTVSADPTPTPTTTPKSNLKKNELKVQVLNGSGVSGAAGKVKTMLVDLGYENIDTGNASVSDLAQTEIAIKETKKEYLSELIKDLAKSYDAVEATKPLVATSKYDVVITVGKK